MFDRFTDRARKVMRLARQEAQRLNHDYIGTEHILLGLVLLVHVEGEASGAARVLKSLGIDPMRIPQQVEKLASPGATRVSMGQLPLTPRAKKVLELSLEEASNLGHTYIGTEHLLLGLIRESEGIAAQVLRNLKVKVEDVREAVLKLVGPDGTGERGPPSGELPLHALGMTADAALLEDDALWALRRAWGLAHAHRAHVVELSLLYGALAGRAGSWPPLGDGVTMSRVLEHVVEEAKAATRGHDAVEPALGDARPRRRRFEPGVLAVIGAAFRRAATREAFRVAARDLLGALLEDDAGIACRTIRAAGLDPATLRPPS